MADPIPAFCLLGALVFLAGVQLLDRYWVRPREQRKWEEAVEPNEIVFPARDEAAITLSYRNRAREAKVNPPWDQDDWRDLCTGEELMAEEEDEK